MKHFLRSLDQKIRYMTGLRLHSLAIVLCITAFVMTGCDGCGQGCQGCFVPCTSVSRVRIEFRHHGVPINDLQTGSSFRLGIVRPGGVSNPLDPTTIPVGGLTGGATGVVNLQSPVYLSDFVDGQNNVKPQPDVGWFIEDSHLCSTEDCGLGRYYKYVPIDPPKFDLDTINCELILQYETHRYCTTCY